MTDSRLPRVVVIGGGFGGLWVARTLRKTPVETILIDSNNHHTFLALLYQVAAAEQTPAEIAYPLRGILRGIGNAELVMATAERVDLAERVVYTDRISVPYDYLVMATGSRSFFYNIPGAEEHAFPLKTLDQAVRLRNHILTCFEHAANEPNEPKRRQLLTFVIVGGGATGIEFAGALAELVQGPFRRDYPDLDFGLVRIILVEAMSHVLVDFPPRLQEYTVERLRRMGVEVLLGAFVEAVSPDAVRIRDGGEIPANTVVWTAGVLGEDLPAASGLPVTRQGRVEVLPTLQVPGHPEAYVVGDLAHVMYQGKPLPMVAPAAIQEGTKAAENILRQIRGQEPEPFAYHDRGRMATIGRNAAVAEIFGRKFTGFIAWVVWIVIHLMNLIGFRNRAIVLFNWLWDYVLMERAIRLIVPSENDEPAEDATKAKEVAAS